MEPKESRVLIPYYKIWLKSVLWFYGTTKNSIDTRWKYAIEKQKITFFLVIHRDHK